MHNKKNSCLLKEATAMKKAFAVILAILAHLSPFAADAVLTAAREYAAETYLVLPRIYTLIGVSILFGLLYGGALVLLAQVKLPLGIPVAGFFASFFYGGFWLFGYLYGWVANYEVLLPAGMFVPFWFLLLLQGVAGHKEALLEGKER